MTSSNSLKPKSTQRQAFDLTVRRLAKDHNPYGTENAERRVNAPHRGASPASKPVALVVPAPGRRRYANPDVKRAVALIDAAKSAGPEHLADRLKSLNDAFDILSVLPHGSGDEALVPLCEIFKLTLESFGGGDAHTMTDPCVVDGIMVLPLNFIERRVGHRGEILRATITNLSRLASSLEVVESHARFRARLIVRRDRLWRELLAFEAMAWHTHETRESFSLCIAGLLGEFKELKSVPRH